MTGEREERGHDETDEIQESGNMEISTLDQKPLSSSEAIERCIMKKVEAACVVDKWK